MATLTVAAAARAGVEVVAGAAACTAGGDEFANTGHEVAIITNGSGAPIVVTFVSQATLDGQAIADHTVSVTNAQTFCIGPFPTGVYNDANNKVQITYASVTTLTIKVVKVTPA